MRKLLLSLVLATAVACGGDSTSPINASIAGTYKLQTINGSALPYTILQFGSDKIEFLDDQVTVNDGGTYTESRSRRDSGSARYRVVLREQC